MAKREVWEKVLRAGSAETLWRGPAERLPPGGGIGARLLEFPADAADGPDGLSRRSFVRLVGGSLALAGLQACTEPPLERILPYTVQPPELTPGVPQQYATAMTLGGYATGLLVESFEGRPTKIEGNPDHPASLGAAGVYEQASILQLYDPARARLIRHGNERASWSDFVAAFARDSAAARGAWAGAGLHFLLEPTGSPLIREQIRRIRERLPATRFHFHTPLAADPAWAGARLAFGRPVQTHHDFSRAATIVSLDADFLAGMPFGLRHAAGWAERRRVSAPADEMNRLYLAEGMLSVTGSVADHRLRIRPSRVARLAAALLSEITRDGGIVFPGIAPDAQAELEGLSFADAEGAWVRAAARDLMVHAGAGIVVAGERQTAETHALVHLLNAALGNTGNTVWYSEPVLADAGELASSLDSLAQAMAAGEVQTLVILESNPALTAPADFGFSALLQRVPTTVCLDLHETETAQLCDWFVPALHFLEAWSDARAFDGTVSIVQPLIRPLYEQNRSPHHLLALFTGEADRTPYQLLRELWQTQTAGDFEPWWEEALHSGVIPGTEAARVDATPDAEVLPELLKRLAAGDSPGSPEAPAGELEAVFLQDPSIYDGRFASNAWLQELPGPMTKLAWDNAAIVSPRTALRLGVEQGDVLEVDHAGRRLGIPAFVLPGVADDLLALHLGYGRPREDAADGAGGGFDAYRLRTTASPYFATGVRATATGEHYPLATAQSHWRMEGRPIALHATLGQFRRDPNFARRQSGRTLSLYKPFEYEGQQWAMAIDQTLCTGCSACVVACQAENNIPTVGKQGVLRSREMHWLRIDRYFTGDPENPAVLSQPMLCQHCEDAPCEYVCPVNATTHSPDGLNQMTYNRCVGTRFCANNCPYKVRRFNWFDYTADLGETEEMAMNPNVTVRARGVIEKCTFCVQRIRRAQIDAEMPGQPEQPPPLQTACQQTCPTRAIIFGSLGDNGSAVARLHQDPRSYAVLEDLGTEPRVRYLAQLSNPNPALAAEATASGESAG